MDKYLAIITTVLVATQIVRLVQNTISLHGQNKIIKAQLNELGELEDDDIRRKITIDKMLIEILPKMGSDTCVCCGCDVPEGRQVYPSCEVRSVTEQRKRMKKKVFNFRHYKESLEV